jgi:hypothetical protein
LSFFEYKDIIYLIRVLKSGVDGFKGAVINYFINCQKLAKFDFLKVFTIILDNFQYLRRSLEFLLKKCGKTLGNEEIKLNLLSTVGLLICPRRRSIATISCVLNTENNQDLSVNWLYNRLKPSYLYNRAGLF